MKASESAAFLGPVLRQDGPLRVIEPATGETLAQVGAAIPEDVAAAAQQAKAAQAGWAALPPRQRAAVFHQAAQLFERHFDELALYVTRESAPCCSRASTRCARPSSSAAMPRRW